MVKLNKTEFIQFILKNALRKIDNTIWDSDLQILSRIIWIISFKIQDFKN